MGTVLDNERLGTGLEPNKNTEVFKYFTFSERKARNLLCLPRVTAYKRLQSAGVTHKDIKTCSLHHMMIRDSSNYSVTWEPPA